MSDYRDYDEEQFYYMNKKPEKKYTGAANEVGDLVAEIVEGVFKFLFRADWVSSAMLSLIAYLLTFKNAWAWYVYAIGAVAIFSVSMILQHANIVFRIIYSIFSCGATAILAMTIIGYETANQKYRILGTAFIIAVIWNLISWKFVVKKE